MVAGDTLDTKAIIRAECANALIFTFNQCKVPVYMLVGNHDLINEKGEAHALNFLKPYVNVVEGPTRVPRLRATLIPYMSNKEALQDLLVRLGKDKTLIMHQGVQTAHMGHYIQDKTSLPPEAFDGFRVISGHYHRAQDIKCGETGLFSYIGNPYTLNFGEANDGPKGFRVLYDDGSLESIPTNLRSHYIVNVDVSTYNAGNWNAYGDDLIWVKVRGTTSELASIKKCGNYKLDLIPTDSAPVQIDTSKLTRAQILDTLIDESGETESQRQVLKKLWRDVLEIA